MPQISRKKVNKSLEQQIYKLFYQLIADIRNFQEAEEFLKDFLTKTELEMMVKRLGIAYYLFQGRKYDNIKTNLAVSSTTVASVNKQMKKKGFQVALKKIQADEWATKWAQKIDKIMKFRHK